MTRRDVEFDAEGVTLRGWFYEAEGSRAPGAAVVMAHGFSAVKEMYLDVFAEVFAAGGLNVVVFDNRCFGASDGEPRQEIDPWVQVRDYRHAITYAGTLPEVDPRRIGIWGSSYSGGHVLVVAAVDRRVKAVVCQVPLISGHANLRALVRADFIAGLREQFDADRLARFRVEPPAMVPVVDSDPLAPSALPTPPSTPRTSPRNSSSCQAAISRPTPRASKPPAGRRATGSAGIWRPDPRARSPEPATATQATARLRRSQPAAGIRATCGIGCEDAGPRALRDLVPWLRAWRRCNRWHAPGAAGNLARLPAHDQKSMLACGSVVAPQNSVILPSRMWLTFATGNSTDLFPREADSMHRATACSSLASTS